MPRSETRSRSWARSSTPTHARACSRHLRRTGGETMEPDVNARALYIISVAAELAGVHPQTLRIYERKGLIEPARTSGRSRRYSDRDIALLRRIQDLTTEGVSLAGVRKILELEDELVDLRRRIADLEDELEEQRRDLKNRVDAVHRQYRRTLVPVKQAVVPFRR